MAGNLYGLFDCAADDTLYPLVAATPGHACLYAGDIDPELAPAAPFIVEVRETDPLLRAFLAEGHGKNWGILCESRLSLSLVRFHFRHYLQARLPDKRVVEFRFYDPRVFRVYFPTCAPDELVRWFDGITRFIVENEAGDGFLEYSLISGRLDVRPAKKPFINAR